MKTFYLLVGAPGVGKSSVVREMLGTCIYDEATRWTLGANVAALGPYRGTRIDGPDTLPPASPLLVASLARAPKRDVLVIDGERFSCPSGQEMLRSAGALRVLLLDAPPLILARRRAQRGSVSMPDEWYRRRVARAAREAGAVAVRIDANRPLRDVVAHVRSHVGAS